MIETSEYLKQLHRPTIRNAYKDMAEQALKHTWSYEQYLHELINQECASRLQNRININLRNSNLPLSKAFGNFDMKRLPAKVAAHLYALVDGFFLNRCAIILAFSNPGSGKTHRLCAIGQELIEKGKRVLFMACSQLVQDLLIAKRDLRIAKVSKKLSRYDAVIVDDIGYIQQSREEREVLFTSLLTGMNAGASW